MIFNFTSVYQKEIIRDASLRVCGFKIISFPFLLFISFRNYGNNCTPFEKFREEILEEKQNLKLTLYFTTGFDFDKGVVIR